MNELWKPCVFLPDQFALFLGKSGSSYNWEAVGTYSNGAERNWICDNFMVLRHDVFPGDALKWITNLLATVSR